MREKLIGFETAKLAKEKGFIFGKSIFHYDYISFPDSNELYIPELEWRIKEIDWKPELKVCTQSLLAKWIREVHNIRVLIDFETIDDSETAYTFKIVKYLPEGKGRKKDTWDFYETTYSFNQGGGWYETYEEALEIGLQRALTLIK